MEIGKTCRTFNHQTDCMHFLISEATVFAKFPIYSTKSGRPSKHGRILHLDSHYDLGRTIKICSQDLDLQFDDTLMDRESYEHPNAITVVFQVLISIATDKLRQACPNGIRIFYPKIDFPARLKCTDTIKLREWWRLMISYPFQILG